MQTFHDQFTAFQANFARLAWEGKHWKVEQITKRQLAGEIPEEWGNAGAFPDLRLLDISSNNISGEMTV